MSKIKIRRDTWSNWYNKQTVLDEGELGYDTTNKELKIGDGTNNFVSLDTYGALPSSAYFSEVGAYTKLYTSGRFTQYADFNSVTLPEFKIERAGQIVTTDSDGATHISSYDSYIQTPSSEPTSPKDKFRLLYGGNTAYDGNWITSDADIVAGTGITKTTDTSGYTVTLAADTSVVATKTDLQSYASIDLSNINDTATNACAHYAMPSDSYVDLTLGASGSTYTAPADGWFTLAIHASATQQYINLGIVGLMSTTVYSSSASGALRVFLPCSKGQTVSYTYTAGGTTDRWRFIYAQGAKS